MRWIDLRTGYRCNQRCRFCDQLGSEPVDASFEAIEARLARAAEEGVRGVWLAGGEVTLRPDLPRLIGRARAFGFTRIGLQTNGRILAVPGAAETLRRQGLTDADVGLQAADPKVHDWIVQAVGAHGQAWMGARRLLAAGVRVRLSTVLVRANVGEIPAITALAARVGAGQRWILGRAEPPQLAHLELLRAPLVAAIEQAWSERREVETIGIPLCVLGAARAAAGDRADLVRPTRVFPEGLAPGEGAPPRAGANESHRKASPAPESYGPPCEACPVRPACPGLPAAYVANRGWHEIGAVSAPARVLLPVVAPCELGCAVCPARDAAGPTWAPEPLRALRQRLVRAVGTGAREVVFAGASPWSHPSLPWLVRDAVRLGATVEVWGPVEPLDPTPPVLEKLAGLARVRVPLLPGDPTRREAVLTGLGTLGCRIDRYVPTPSSMPSLHEAVGPAAVWGGCAAPDDRAD